MKFQFFQDWLDDDDNFVSDFLPYTQKRFDESGIRPYFRMSNTKEALSEWREYCAKWISSEMLPIGSHEISHKKLGAALYYFLVKHQAVSVFKNEASENDLLPDVKDVNQIGDTSNKLLLQKLLSGDTVFICFDYVYNIIEYFEIHREDKLDPYRARISSGMERDFIKLMIEENPSPKNIHVILKAIFLRD